MKGWKKKMSEMLLFKDLLRENDASIKQYMKWDNYELNDTVIQVVDLVKDHALMVLSKSYGLFHVEQDILDSLKADIFIYFPILLQHLAITRLIDAFGVVKDDINTQETVRQEKVNTKIDQSGKTTLGTSTMNTDEINTQQKTTGTVKVADSNKTDSLSSTSITNISGIESTGNRSVNITHTLPEQSINQGTGFFPIDEQGTPILSSSFVQNANESFNTNNPIDTLESSEQSMTNKGNSTGDSTSTSDLTVANTGTNIAKLSHSGSDSTEGLTKTDGLNDITEKITSTETNKQYAYEIKAFLETSDTLIAFSKWEDRFSWVVGII